MDVALSLATGFGLRVYLTRFTSPTSLLAPAVVGIWEGILVHQLSFHPPSSVTSSVLDHYLAFGLRLVVDFLIAGNWTRVMLVGMWACIGTFISESAFPGISVPVISTPSSTSSGSGHRDREKRRRHSRSVPPFIPSHVRVYQAPMTPPALPIPPRTSTPPLPTINTNISGLNGQAMSMPYFPPPSPPSFFLHANSELSAFSNSPTSPAPIITQEVPSRPHSALAFYQEGAKGPGPENTGPSPSPLLPTPPDSTIRERTLDSRIDRLSTIDEITSRSEHIDNEDIEQKDVEGDEHYVLVSHNGGVLPLPVPNSESRYIRIEDEVDDQEALPIPPKLDSRPRTPSDGGDELMTPIQLAYEMGSDSDPDELLTPPKMRACEVDQNEIAVIPEEKPIYAPIPVVKVDKALSPLLFDTSIQDSVPVPSSSLSTYAILQPPVPPTPLGPLLIHVAPEPSGSAEIVVEKPSQIVELEVPLSPSVNSEASVLSTRIPLKLLEHGNEMRKQALELDRELARLRNELRQAEHERRAKDALFLREDIDKTEEKKNKLNEKAARRFFAGRNNLQKPNTIDVHGLKPGEALEKTEQAFRDTLRSGAGTLKVIVGKGIHSKGGVPVVKNSIIRTMQSRHIPCEVDPKNSGILILRLPVT